MLIRMNIRNGSTKNNNKEFERYLIHLTASWSLFSDQEHCWTEGDGCQWTRDTPHLCSTTGGGIWGGGTPPYTEDSGEWVRGGGTTPHTEENGEWVWGGGTMPHTVDSGKWAFRLAGMYGVGNSATYQGQWWVCTGWGNYATHTLRTVVSVLGGGTMPHTKYSGNYQRQWWVSQKTGRNELVGGNTFTLMVCRSSSKSDSEKTKEFTLSYFSVELYNTSCLIILNIQVICKWLCNFNFSYDVLGVMSEYDGL